LNLLLLFGRFWRISILITIGVVGYAGGRIRRLFIRDKERRRSAVAQLRGSVLRKLLTRLGPTYIKLGQVMSSRPDLLEPEVIDELGTLQDSVPAVAYPAISAVVEKDLGGPLSSFFDTFERAPVAAASIAQVHRATLKSGEEVAVKVVRPGTIKRIRSDRSILLAFARIASIHPVAKHGDLVGHLEHFLDAIEDQADLTIEAANYRLFRKNFEGFEGVVFPAVFPKNSGPSVLTMDFIRGKKVDQLDPGDHSEIAARLRAMFFKMCFEDGLLHADLHPGNIFITDAGDVAVFDVGLAKELNEELLHMFIDFNRCLVLGTAPDFVHHLKTYHSYMSGEVDWDELTAEVTEFVKSFRSLSSADLEARDIFDGVFAIGRKYHIQPEPAFVLMIVGSVTAEGVGKILAPEVNTTEEMANFLLPILQKRGMLRN